MAPKKVTKKATKTAKKAISSAKKYFYMPQPVRNMIYAFTALGLLGCVYVFVQLCHFLYTCCFVCGGC